MKALCFLWEESDRDYAMNRGNNFKLRLHHINVNVADKFIIFSELAIANVNKGDSNLAAKVFRPTFGIIAIFPHYCGEI